MSTLIEALLLGLVGGLVPGAVLTMILVAVLQGGKLEGIKTFWYCVLSEIAIVSVLLLFVLLLPIPTTSFHAIGIIGALFLLYIAYQVSQIKSVHQPDIQHVSVVSPLKIFVLSATNTPLYIFWLTVCLPIMLQFADTLGSTVIAAASFMVAFEIGWVLSTFILLLLFIKAKKLLTNEIYVSFAFKLIAFVLVVFSFRLGWESLANLNVF